MDPVDRTYKLEDCISMAGGFDVPAEFARGWIPEGFDPFVLLPGTVSIFVTADWCQRAVFGDTVIADVRRVQFALNAEPVNESWLPELAPSRFILDTFVSSDAAAGFLSRMGDSATIAQIKISYVRNEQSILWAWSVAVDGDSIAFTYPAHGRASPNENPIVSFHFAGPNPYIRIKEQFWDTRASPGNSAGRIDFADLGNISLLAQLPHYALRVNPSVLGETSGHVDPVFLAARGAEE